MSIKESTAVIAETENLAAAAIPDYLQQTYWWAYLHPTGVRFFERQWLVNTILWGNFAKLRDEALDAVGPVIDGKVLQVACVYGDFTEQLARRMSQQGTLDVVDVAPIQLDNLAQKLGDNHPRVALHQQDSTQLAFETASRDVVVVFFLLHEQPDPARRQTIAEALRVTKPGGKLIFVDYHRPDLTNPFRYVMVPILATLEPFAMDLWDQNITDWFPTGVTVSHVDKQTYFGGLYQKVVITR